MNNWGLVIGLVLAVIFVIVILLIALPPLIQFQKDEAQRKLIDNLDDSHRLMCGTPDQLGIIFDRLDSISSDKFILIVSSISSVLSKVPETTSLMNFLY